MMSAIKLTIHSTGMGTCSLTGKEGADGLTVSFEDNTVREQFLSWRGFRQLLGMKAGQAAKSEQRPELKASVAMAIPANGPAK